MAAPNGRKREKFKRLKPIEFGEHPGPEPFNASEIAAIADSRFLFCDNNIGDGLFELRLTPDGSMAGPLIRRQLSGIEPGTVDDLECMVLVEARGRRFLILSPSLSLKRAKGNESRGKISAARSCLLRVSLNTDDQLAAEVMPDFRRWLVGHAPLLVEPQRDCRTMAD
jgi:hypothetical protein